MITTSLAALGAAVILVLVVLGLDKVIDFIMKKEKK